MNRTVGRPLEFDPDAALEAAMQLFWRKGYEQTSMQDLLNVTDISKSSLYQTFGGKRDLFNRCVSHYGDQFVMQMRAKLDQSPSGMAFITAFLESVLNEVTGVCEARGCFVLNTANEFSQRDQEIAMSVGEQLRRFRDLLLLAVQRAQADGDIPGDSDPAALANYLVNSMSGLKTLAKAGSSEESLRAIIHLVLKTLK